MIIPPRFSLIFKPLFFTAALVTTSVVHSAEIVENNMVKSPWAFDLKIYAWMPSVDGNFSAGRFDKTADIGFINIIENMRNFPMTFNGRVEAHYERVGFYLDGNYMGLDFKPRLEYGTSKGLSTRMGIMDYGVSYRLFGASAAERVSNWDAKTSSNSFDVYTGGRTIWLGNKAEFAGVSASSDSSITAPVIGGRVNVDITPK